MSQQGLQNPKFQQRQEIKPGCTCLISYSMQRQPIWVLARISLMVVFFIASSKGMLAQRGNEWRNYVDILVERADSLSLKSQNTFYQNRIIKVDKTFKNDKTIRETWYYTVSNNKVIIFQVRYLIDSSEYTETYYMDNGSLICLEQYETDFFSPYDEINWGKVLYFDNRTLKLNITVGSRKSNNTIATTASEALEIFNKRYSELLRNLRQRRING